MCAMCETVEFSRSLCGFSTGRGDGVGENSAPDDQI